MKRFLFAIRNPEFWPWLICLPGVILRLWDITSSPIWYDEAFTRLVVNLPLDRLFQATAGDVHPPLYYMMLSGFTSLFGNSNLAIRMFSMVCSALALKDFWSLTGELSLPRSTRLVALAIMAYNPVSIYYAQEARMYAWLQWLVINQALYMLRRKWWMLGIYTFMALYSHNYSLLYTALIGVWGMAREFRARPGLVSLLASIGIPGVLWLPWISVLLGQMTVVQDHYWIQPLTAGTTIQAVVQILGGFHIPDPLLPWGVFTLSAGLTLVLIIGYQRKRYAWLMLAFGPLAISVTVSIAWHPMLLFRGLIGSLPAFALLAGDALVAATKRGRVIGLVMLSPLAFALVWQIGANHIGAIKSVPLFQQPAATTLPIIHMDDTTLILSEAPDNNYLLDAGCAAEGGTLTDKTHDAFGFKSVRLSDLPDHYVLAGMITPLTNACRENIYHQLIQNAKPLYQVRERLGEYGIWIHE